MTAPDETMEDRLNRPATAKQMEVVRRRRLAPAGQSLTVREATRLIAQFMQRSRSGATGGTK